MQELKYEKKKVKKITYFQNKFREKTVFLFFKTIPIGKQALTIPIRKQALDTFIIKIVELGS